jgi:beta-galactosidase
MKPYFTSLILAALICSCSLIKDNKSSETLFDFGWKFALNNQPGAEQPGYDDSNWRQLDLPHDFSIEQPFDSLNKSGQNGAYAYGGIGWYRKHFIIPVTSKGDRFIIRFNGVYRNSEVWLNGHLLGNRPYGYSTFSYNLTPWLKKKGEENVIAVKVNTSDQPNSRWYSGAGIYRHVWLKSSGEAYFPEGGIFVNTSKIAEGNALLHVSCEIQNSASDRGEFKLKMTVKDQKGKKVADISHKVNRAKGDFQIISSTFKVMNAKLWSINNPYLYTVDVFLIAGNKQLDHFQTKYGIREFSFDPVKGFFLNGEHIKLKGVNNHHDGGPLGAACLDYTFQRQLKILKGMGCNALRMSHNPPAPELLDCADSMGFVVIDEIFDEWINGKKEFGYAPEFDKWHEKDIADWMRRDRNHPSVIAWSLGNEVREQTMNSATDILKQLTEVALHYDISRPFTSACNEIIADNQSGFANLLGIVGYNYQEPNYAKDHATYPNRIIYGTETVMYPLHDGSGYPLHSYNEWLTGQQSDYVAGEFLWTGFDYLGETGIGAGGYGLEPWNTWPQWPWRSAVCGVVDLCGFEKPGYWYRKSLWDEAPMVYIAVPYKPDGNDIHKCSFWGWPAVISHWNHAILNDTLTVQVYTNCQDNELFLNGKSLGCKKWDIQKEPFLTWEIPYRPGKLEAIGTPAKGSKTHYAIETAGDPVKIVLTADRKNIVANRQDINYIKVNLIDAKGNHVPFAQNVIHFKTSGVGQLIAVGNGNPASHTSFKGDEMEAWQGTCLAIVQSGDKPGKMKIEASSKGLETAALVIDVVKEKK